MEAMEALPEMKLPAETETDEYAKRIAYWKEQATTMPNGTGSASYAAYDLRRKANAVKLLQCERDIVVGIRTIGEQFLVIGKNLMEIQANQLHLFVPMRDDSWIQSWSFEDYVARNFGFKKSTAYSLIGVYREFGTATCKLKEEYAGFGYSQLVEMLPMEYSERQKVTAGMTVKEIREIRQNGERRAAVLPKPIEPVTVEAVKVTDESEMFEQSIGFRTSGNEVIQDSPRLSGRPENENNTEQASPVRTSGNDDPDEAAITYFKNDSARKTFLGEYKTWSLWLTVSALNFEVYRVSLTDGATILAIEYTERAIEDVHGEHRCVKYLLFKPDETICLDFYTTAPTYIVQYMSSHKVGVYWVDDRQPD